MEVPSDCGSKPEGIGCLPTHTESFLSTYDASADGRRFVMVTSTPQKLPSPITVVVNWMANLKR